MSEPAPKAQKANKQCLTRRLTNTVSTISVSMRKLLALNSLRDADYRVIEFVGTPERSECLRKGQCDGVPLGQPEDFVLLKQGYRRLRISNDALPNFQFKRWNGGSGVRSGVRLWYFAY